MAKKKPKKPHRHWNLLKDGVTQSLLAKFSNDTERFHIRTIRGLKPVSRKEAMTYGTIFHQLIEIGLLMGNKYSHASATRYISEFVRKSYGTQGDILLGKIALEQFKHYRQWEKDLPDFKTFATEDVFEQPYRLPPTTYRPCPEITVVIPPGIEIPLRGRIDGIIERDGLLYLQENKTKSRIDMSSIESSICLNIQVMFYAVCAQLKYGRPIHGVVYNIIRKPELRQRTGRDSKDKKTGKVKRVGAETDNQFVKRIGEDITNAPEHYFKRLIYEFPPGSIERWQRRSLEPMLYEIYLWWKSIESHPFDPWQDAQGNPNPFHGEKPYGIYDPMSNGLGEYHRLLTTGSTLDLAVDVNQFPELGDDDELVALFHKVTGTKPNAHDASRKGQTKTH